MKAKVIVVGPIPPPYHGVATFTRDLLAHFHHPQIELLHLDTSDRRDTTNLGKWDPTNIQLGFSNLSELAGRCVKSGADIVYIPISQNAPAFMRDALFILQARALGCKVVLHLHGGYFKQMYEQPNFFGGNEFFRKFVRMAFSAVSAAVVLADEFRPVFGNLLPDSKIFVVENGVPECGAWEIREKSVKHSAETLLYMGTLMRTKGVFELVQAIAILKQSRPAVKLRLAGNWENDDTKTKVLEFIDREQMNSFVEFAGNVSGAAKAEFLASGDIFCLPTRYIYEGQPLAVLEAMSAGLPIFGTTHAAMASTAPDGVCGKLISKDADASTIAASLGCMLENSNALQEFSDNSRRRYLEKYTLQTCHRRLADVFTNFLS
jgi:glycosyltransferase involved in cell wall biosynthesis